MRKIFRDKKKGRGSIRKRNYFLIEEKGVFYEKKFLAEG